jgi:osmoprotectant transport system permease protein
VNFFAAAFAYIFDGGHWAEPNGIGQRLAEHLLYTGVSIGIALVIAVPLGLAIGHTGRGRAFVIGLTGAARALPTFGFLLFIVLLAGLGLAPLIAVLVVLAIPPLLAGVYAGIEAVDRQPIDAARAIGMSEWQVLGRVEVPLGIPLMVGGLRSAVLQVIATATIAGFVAQGGLGRYLIEGLARRDFVLAIVGAILVAALALAIDGLLAVVQKLVDPRGVSRRPARPTNTRFRRPSRSPEANRTLITEG